MLQLCILALFGVTVWTMLQWCYSRLWSNLYCLFCGGLLVWNILTSVKNPTQCLGNLVRSGFYANLRVWE
jgi:hypothetical protein